MSRQDKEMVVGLIVGIVFAVVVSFFAVGGF